ncbi:MAG TPA: threonine/serine exporter family protein [Candidatus Eubacterium faecigallinarum]|nr:threonine/serine exporter family protein [Candidatus Eubacterium faecigallinarum]
MKESILQVIMAGIGTLGFSIYFRVREKNVAASTAAGIIGWAIYLLIFHFTEQLFLSNFVAAFLVYLYAEIMARILKAPSNIFLIPGIIPLLPGGTLYYTMQAIVEGDRDTAVLQGTQTAIITVGIAAGIVVGTVLFYYIVRRSTEKKSK